MDTLSTPVLFVIFNRPDVTAQVFEAIRAARPTTLYVAGDGPRDSRPGEADLVRQTREVIKVDWPCTVKTFYREKNVGCRLGVSGAVSWFFENEEEGIILEDDCVPEPSFFRFCSELLEKYRYDERIFMVCGGNFEPVPRDRSESYYFSRIAHIWGWASWRRAWSLYDADLKSLDRAVQDDSLRRTLRNPKAWTYWERQLTACRDGKIDTWDYQVAFSMWVQSMVSIVPAVNMITNIGFGPAATHTFRENRFANMPTTPTRFPLQHPPFVLADHRADEGVIEEQFVQKPLWKRALNRLRRR